MTLIHLIFSRKESASKEILSRKLYFHGFCIFTVLKWWLRCGCWRGLCGPCARFICHRREHQIRNFFFLCWFFFFLIVVGVSRLSWTRLEGSCSRKFQIPEISSVTSWAIMCCICGMLFRTKVLSDPVIWAYLECWWLEHHCELLCLADSGNPFSEIMGLLPSSGWILQVRFGSK